MGWKDLLRTRCSLPVPPGTFKTNITTKDTWVQRNSDGWFGSVLFAGIAEANTENWQMVGLRSTYIVDLLFSKSAFSSREGHFRSWLRTKWRVCSIGKYLLFIWGSSCLADAWCTLSGDGLKRRHLSLVLKKFSKHIWALMFGHKNVLIWVPRGSPLSALLSLRLW